MHYFQRTLFANAFLASSLIPAFSQDAAPDVREQAYAAARDHLLVGTITTIGGLAGVAIGLKGALSLNPTSVYPLTTGSLALSFSSVELIIGATALTTAANGHYAESFKLSQQAGLGLKIASDATTAAGALTLLSSTALGISQKDALGYTAFAADGERLVLITDGLKSSGELIGENWKTTTTVSVAFGSAVNEYFKSLQSIKENINAMEREEQQKREREETERQRDAIPDGYNRMPQQDTEINSNDRALTDTPAVIAVNRLGNGGGGDAAPRTVSPQGYDPNCDVDNRLNYFANCPH